MNTNNTTNNIARLANNLYVSLLGSFNTGEEVAIIGEKETSYHVMIGCASFYTNKSNIVFCEH